MFVLLCSENMAVVVCTVRIETIWRYNNSPYGTVKTAAAAIVRESRFPLLTSLVIALLFILTSLISKYTVA